MRLYLLLATAALAIRLGCVSANADNDGLEVQVGRLLLQGNYATQTVAVKNLTSHPFSQIKVSCGFFKDQELIDAAWGLLTISRRGIRDIQT